MSKLPSKGFIGGLEVQVVKNSYTWLWEIRYVDGASVWAGPFKTKKKACEKLADSVLS